MLCPTDEKERNRCTEHLEPIFATLETLPVVRTEICLGKLPYDAFLYVCHPVRTRKRQEDGRFAYVDEVHLSNPIDCSKYTLQGMDEDGLGGTNVPALTDALTAACQNTRQDRVYVARLSAEKMMEAKVVKLWNQ